MHQATQDVGGIRWATAAGADLFGSDGSKRGSEARQEIIVLDLDMGKLEVNEKLFTWVLGRGHAGASGIDEGMIWLGCKKYASGPCMNCGTNCECTERDWQMAKTITWACRALLGVQNSQQKWWAWWVSAHCIIKKMLIDVLRTSSSTSVGGCINEG